MLAHGGTEFKKPISILKAGVSGTRALSEAVAAMSRDAGNDLGYSGSVATCSHLFYDYNFEMMRLAMAIWASRPPGNKRASSCTLTSLLRNMKRLKRGPDIASSPTPFISSRID